ncbi:MAG TPA: cupin domain-containing protein [Bacteroidales bacterium]|nr:cupin domain-containing protein [Bacteroidales bacterium]
MDKDFLKSKIKTNVYHIKPDSNVALHKHQKFDEVFYCMKGEGFGVLENEEQELTVGKAFIVKENTMHALRSDSEMWVASFLIPVTD